MGAFIFIIGLIIGIILKFVTDGISSKINKSKKRIGNIFIPITCATSFEILFLRLGFTSILAKAIVMTIILIVISFIDLWHRIIPDFLVVITLISGLIFTFLIKASIIDTVLGMLAGGGILFMLALIPNVMGGGDIKLIFAIGSFLGFNRVLWALLLAFIMSSIVSIILILFRVKSIKDYIPFGPFLSLGSFFALVIFI